MLRQGVPLAGIPTPTRPGAPGGQGFGLSPFSPPQGGPGKGQGQRKKPSFRGSPQEQRCICDKTLQSRLTLCNSMDCSSPGPLSMGFSRQEYSSGFPSPPPGDRLDPGVEPAVLMSPVLAGRFFTTSTTWETQEQRYWEQSQVFKDDQDLPGEWRPYAGPIWEGIQAEIKWEGQRGQLQGRGR